MSVAELHHFLSPILEDVSYAQVVRRLGQAPGKSAPVGSLRTKVDGSDDCYAVFLAFHDAKSTEVFVSQTRGRRFAELDPRAARVSYLASAKAVELLPEESGVEGKTDAVETGRKQGVWHFPPRGGSAIYKCPVCLDPIISGDANSTSEMGSTDTKVTSNATSAAEDGAIPPAAPPLTSATSTSSAIRTTAGITAVCLHHFHFDCLAKWAEASCPVCRSSTHPSPPLSCDVCRRPNDLWLCVICGCVCCSQHNKEHFAATSHTYALRIGASVGPDQQVYDHASQTYVERLVQTVTGKTVALGPGIGGVEAGADGRGVSQASSGIARATSPTLGLSAEERATSIKLEQISEEFNHLLAIQLASQRKDFEGTLRCARTASARRARDTAAELAELRRDNAAAKREADASRKKLAEAKAQRKTLELSLADLATKKERMQTLNRALITQQKALRAKHVRQERELDEKHARRIAERKGTIRDLQDQIRDLKGFLTSRTSIQAAKRQGATVVATTVEPVSQRERKKARSRSRGKRKGRQKGRR